MKKILYIIPMLVLAMVVLAQDAKAQSNGSTVSGQTGNASNAVTQNITSSVITNALGGTVNNAEGKGGNGGTGTNINTVQAVAPRVQTTMKLSIDANNLDSPTVFTKSTIAAIALAANSQQVSLNILDAR